VHHKNNNITGTGIESFSAHPLEFSAARFATNAASLTATRPASRDTSRTAAAPGCCTLESHQPDTQSNVEPLPWKLSHFLDLDFPLPIAKTSERILAILKDYPARQRSCTISPQVSSCAILGYLSGKI
jgi:hypothetical protein